MSVKKEQDSSERKSLNPRQSEFSDKRDSLQNRSKGVLQDQDQNNLENSLDFQGNSNQGYKITDLVLEGVGNHGQSTYLSDYSNSNLYNIQNKRGFSYVGSRFNSHDYSHYHDTSGEKSTYWENFKKSYMSQYQAVREQMDGILEHLDEKMNGTIKKKEKDLIETYKNSMVKVTLEFKQLQEKYNSLYETLNVDHKVQQVEKSLKFYCQQTKELSKVNSQMQEQIKRYGDEVVILRQQLQANKKLMVKMQRENFQLNQSIYETNCFNKQTIEKTNARERNFSVSIQEEEQEKEEEQKSRSRNNYREIDLNKEILQVMKENKFELDEIIENQIENKISAFLENQNQKIKKLQRIIQKQKNWENEQKEKSFFVRDIFENTFVEVQNELKNNKKWEINESIQLVKNFILNPKIQIFIKKCFLEENKETNQFQESIIRPKRSGISTHSHTPQKLNYSDQTYLNSSTINNHHSNNSNIHNNYSTINHYNKQNHPKRFGSQGGNNSRQSPQKQQINSNQNTLEFKQNKNLINQINQNQQYNPPGSSASKYYKIKKEYQSQDNEQQNQQNKFNSYSVNQTYSRQTSFRPGKVYEKILDPIKYINRIEDKLNLSNYSSQFNN